MAEPTVEAQFNQATVETQINNQKGISDSWQADFMQQAKQRQGLQDAINQQYLKMMADQSTLTLRTADFGASGLQKHRDTLDALTYLILSGEIDTTAQGAMGANVAKEVASAAKQAIDSSIAGMATTGGVAQGALQTQAPIELAQILTNNNTIQTAILKALTDVNSALGVILVKVTGEAVVAPVKPTVA